MKLIMSCLFFVSLLIMHGFYLFLVNQDAASHKRMKLNYEEVTPCLMKASVMKWEEILITSDPDKRVDKSILTEMVRSGKFYFLNYQLYKFVSEMVFLQECSSV